MVQKEINELGQFIPLHYHFQMLSDTFRMAAFRTAIEQAVKSEYRVLELGSGTGIMSFLAAKQGAKVSAVEFNPELVTASREFLKKNGMSTQVEVFQADASSWLPEEPVDLVICEMLHSALLREKQVQVISDFRDAHYARFGKIPQFLPGATLLGVQPVLQNYDFSGYYAPVPLFQSAYTTANDCCPCCDPVVYKIFDYENAHVEIFDSAVLFPFKQDTNVNALRFITKSLLVMNLSTGKTVDWYSQHMVLPLQQSLRLQPGQTLRVSFSYKPGDNIEILNNAIEVEIINSEV